MKTLSRAGTWWPRFGHFLPILAASAIGIAASIAGWHAAALQADRLAALDFQARAKSRASILQNGIDEYSNSIAAVRAFFESSHVVEREEFSIFAEQLLGDRAAILRVSWIPRIGRDERRTHELEAARQGLEGYRIHDIATERPSAPSPERDEYYPVLFAAGVGATSDVYGLDIASEPMRRRALERARDTGGMAAAPNIALNTTTGNRQGFFVLSPVYRQGAPHGTTEDRRRNLVGFVNGVFETRMMIESILAAAAIPGDLDDHFFAADAAPGTVPFYAHSSRRRSASIRSQTLAALTGGLHWSSEIRLGDGRWTFVATPTPGGPGIATHGRAWIVLIAGVLFTGLVVEYMWTSIRHARRLEAAMKSLDRTLVELESQNTLFDAALNNMSEGLCMFDGQQRLLVSNARYAQMYGLQPEQLKPGMTQNEIFEMRNARGGHAREIPEEYAREMLSMAARGHANDPTPNTQ